MELSKKKMLELFQEYQFCMKIFENRYRAMPQTQKEDMRQAARIGIWKGICDCFRKAKNEEEASKNLKNAIYYHMKWEIACTLQMNTLVHIPPALWSDYKKVKKLLEENPDATEEEIKNLPGSEHKLESYQKISNFVNEMKSLNFTEDDSEEETIGSITGKRDESFEQIDQREHLRYLINSALFAIERERDKNIIKDWLKSVYLGDELKHGALGKKNGTSSGTARMALKKFQEICIFLEQSEQRLTMEEAETLRFYKLEETGKAQRRRIAANERGE